jgi:hypothetical protein
MILSRTTEAHREASRRGSVNRAFNEFSTETWALDPLDVMTAEQFEQHLVSLYGAEYLEPVQYHRHHGKLEIDPVRTEVAELFRRYGTLTHFEVLRLTGLNHGHIAEIVKEPTYVIADVAKVSHGYANKWKLAK